MNKEIWGISIKYWLIVVIVPVLVNILAWIPNPIARGDYETWVGFFGNYSGGIVGAFIALVIAKSQSSIAIKQLEQERDQIALEKERERQEKEEREKSICRCCAYLFI